MFGLDEQTVKTAVQLRGNFDVIWCEALHFLQPAEDPFQGSIKVSVHAPAKSQIRGADDHGFIGDLEIDLARDPLMEDEAWSRRVRRELIRPTRGKPKEQETMKTRCNPTVKLKQSFGETDKDKTNNRPEGMEGSGIVLEMLIEVRKLREATCELEPGQPERTPEELRRASMNSGVRITKA